MRVYSRNGAAKYVTDKLGRKVSPHLLDILANKGGGPLYSIWRGGAQYLEANLDLWIEEMLASAYASASEHKAARAKANPALLARRERRSKAARAAQPHGRKHRQAKAATADPPAPTA